MLVYRTFSEVRQYLDQQTNTGNTIGFVPTMGALHAGHLSLISESQKQCSITVCSIFVNPAQFNKKEDLLKYPRSDDADLVKLKAIGCDIVFMPEVEEVYPEGNTFEPIELNGLDRMMEGAHRPGHFNGVVQVIWRFFEQIQPHQAFFGEKDFQQLAVIQRLVEVKKSITEIVPCSIIREAYGLAMSSRNVRVSEAGLSKSIFIFDQLNWAKSVFQNTEPVHIIEKVKRAFQNKPEFELEYFEISDINNLQPISGRDIKARAFIAVRIEGVRLIDNIAVNY